MATAKEMRESAAEGALKLKPNEEEVSIKDTLTVDEPPELEQFYGKGPGKNYINPDGDPYSYRMYDDGSIEIIAGPSGVGTILTEGVAYDAIKKAVGGAKEEVVEEAAVAEEAPAPEIEEVPEKETDSAMESLASTMPTYIADEEHLGKLREGFEEALPTEALAEQSAMDAAEAELAEGPLPEEPPKEERGFTPFPSGGIEKLYHLAKRLLAEEKAAS